MQVPDLLLKFALFFIDVSQVVFDERLDIKKLLMGHHWLGWSWRWDRWTLVSFKRLVSFTWCSFLCIWLNFAKVLLALVLWLTRWSFLFLGFRLGIYDRLPDIHILFIDRISSFHTSRPILLFLNGGKDWRSNIGPWNWFLLFFHIIFLLHTPAIYIASLLLRPVHALPLRNWL